MNDNESRRMNIPDNFPLCIFFLFRYLQKKPHDELNFPSDQFPDGFKRYETLFHDGLFHLKVSKKNGVKVCFEVKTVTKRSKGRKNLFLEEQLYEKIREEIGKARKQLISSA